MCTDCHGVHDIRPSGEANSSVSRLHVPDTCGKCHKEVLQAVSGEHTWQGSGERCEERARLHGLPRRASASASHRRPIRRSIPTHVVATCSKCHENAKIQRRYGLPANRLSSYISSYHGVANKYGDVTVANCATCHGAHDVLPSSDPSPALTRRTCRKPAASAIPGAGKNFADRLIHVVPTPKHDADRVLGAHVLHAVRGGADRLVLRLYRARPARPMDRPLALEKRRSSKMTTKPERSARAPLQEDDAQPAHSAYCPDDQLLHAGADGVSGDVSIIRPLHRESSDLLGGFTMRSGMHRMAAVMLIGLTIYHMFYMF